MARPKFADRNMPPRRKLKGITFNVDATSSKAKTIKLPTYGGNDKGKNKAHASSDEKSDSDNIYATHLTSSESEGEP